MKRESRDVYILFTVPGTFDEVVERVGRERLP